MPPMTLDSADINALDAAVALLRRAAPDEALHLGALERIVYDPAGCDHPQALACTGGRWARHGRIAVLVEKPSRLALVDLAERVWHEGAHWVWVPAEGRYVLHHHDDETSPDRHLTDWLYRRQHVLRTKLVAALRPQPSLFARIVEGAMLVGGVTGAVVGAVTVGAAIGEALADRPRRATRRAR